MNDATDVDKTTGKPESTELPDKLMDNPSESSDEVAKNPTVDTATVVSADSNSGDAIPNPQSSSGPSDEVVKSAGPSGSTLLRWGTWVYSYAPMARQPSSSTPAVTTVEEDTSGIQPAPLSDPEQQLMEGNVYESIGTSPNSDIKEQAYDRTSTEPESGTQTEQGIGVDPRHRSEVPEGPDQGFTSGNTGGWSVSALASSAWAWGRGRDATSMEPDTRSSEEQKTETMGMADQSALTVPESLINTGNSEGIATSDSDSAVTQSTAVGDIEMAPSRINAPPPGWSGYLGTWLNRTPSTPSGKVASAAPLDAGDVTSSLMPRVPDRPDPRLEHESDRCDDAATGLVHQSGNSSLDGASESLGQVPPPSSDQLSGINAANEAYLQHHTADTGRLSRTAWALATASRWVGGNRPTTQTENQVIPTAGPTTQGGSSTSGVPDVPPQLKNKRIATTAHSAQPSEVHRSQHASSFFTAAPSVLMTPELLEARPSPLLPSSTSILSRPNLILPSFNHTFSRLPRGYSNPSIEVTSTEEVKSRDSERTLRVPFMRQRSPPSIAWRALGAVSQYARGAHRDGDLDSDPVKVERKGSIETEKNPLPLLASSGKERWDGIRRVVIIGVHGWFPNAHVQK